MKRCMVSILVLLAGLAAAADALHDPWDTLLQAHVKDGWVDYRGIQAAPEKLDSYLNALAAADPEAMSRDEQLAFWINAYNAFTIKLILNHYPLKSINDIEKPWDQKVWKAGGKTYSLNEIEHAILRPKYREPRIHFAIVCASIGCPDLQEYAFRGSRIEAQLKAATSEFLSSDKHIRLSEQRRALGRKKKTLQISAIFNWFGEDFTANGTQSVASFVARHADEETRRWIEAAGNRLSIEFLEYDWNLNGQ